MKIQWVAVFDALIGAFLLGCGVFSGFALCTGIAYVMFCAHYHLPMH